MNKNNETNETLLQALKNNAKRGFTTGLFSYCKWGLIVTLGIVGVFYYLMRFEPDVIRNSIKDPKELKQYNEMRKQNGWDK